MSDEQVLQKKLGLPSAPRVLEALRTTCGFFRNVLHEDPTFWWEYLRGIDFHQPVRVELLPAGTSLSQHQSLGAARSKPFVYFTVPGVSPTSTGTTFDRVQFKLYKTTHVTQALASIASAISFNDMRTGKLDSVSRMGGGKQFIIAARDVPPLVRAGAP
jgi:hypothetical protein